MSQRIVIECDECSELGETREAVTVEVRTLGRELVVDLCDVHAKPLAELVDRLAEIGRKPSEAGVGRVPCPRCGRKFASPQALGRHARDEHGESVNSMRGKASKAAPVVAELPCPECSRTFTKSQGLAVHRRRTHGVEGTSERSRERHADAESSDG